ncbi:MAG: hypothetical protein J5894_04335 [Clostridia bacterium]|nr:hypothetical protein [Clostridia bacterium]
MKKIFFAILAVILCICAVGAVLLTTIISSEISPETDIIGHNLSLNDSVNILYYVDFKNVPSGAEKGVLVWTSAQDEYVYGSEKTKITTIRGTVSGYATYAFTGVAAKMMTQDIYAKSYIKVGDEITYGPLDKYSVLQYAYNKKGSTTMVQNGTVQLGELLEKMLDYGAWAQKYFGYNLDRLANETYYKVEVVNGTLPDGTTAGLYPSGATVTLTADSDDANCWKKSSGANVGLNRTLVVTVAGNETYTASHVDDDEPVIIVWDGTTAASFAGGDGTENDPYLISTPEQFAYFAERNNTEKPTGEYYKLTADLYFNLGDASEWGDDFDGNETTDIVVGPLWSLSDHGNNANPFAGTFDGDGHTISGFYVKKNTRCAAVFGSTAKGDTATIKNLVITNSYFEGAGTMGALIGSTSGGTTNVSNVFVTDSVYIVSSGNYVGGLVGHNGNNGYNLSPTLNIENCVNGATVSASGHDCVGGIAGNANANTVHVTNCLNYGSITGNNFVSGIMGLGNSKNATVSYSVNIGALSGSSPCQTTCSGNISNKPTVSYCFAINSSYGTNITSSNCVTITKDAFLKEGFLDTTGATLADEWTELAYSQSGASGIETVKEICVPTALFNAIKGEFPQTSCYNVSIYNPASIPSWVFENYSQGTLTINTVEQYKEFADLYNEAVFETEDINIATVALGADLTFNIGNASDWRYSAPANDMTDYIIGNSSNPFTGTFDGNGHTISGFYAKRSGESNVGLFGAASAATVRDLIIQNSCFEATEGNASAVIAETLSDTTRVDTVYVKDSVYVVSGGDNAGAVIAYGNNTLYIENCINAATVSGSGLNFGGIVGKGNKKYGNISHCLNVGDISTTSTVTNVYLGGIIGRNDGTTNITDTLNVGDVNAKSMNAVGGIFGAGDGGTASITNVYTVGSNPYGRSGSTASWTYKKIERIDDSIIGLDAYDNMLLDFDDYWTIVEDDIPTLIAFADTVIDTPDRDIYAEEVATLDWDEIPEFSYGTLSSEYKVGEARYDIDSFARKYTETTDEDFEDYIAILGANGYTCHATNDIDGECYQATYYNNEYTVNVAYYAITGETFITAEQKGTLSELQIAPAKQVTSDETIYVSPRLAEFGECDIFKLSNGHFVVIDGAQKSNAELLIQTLEAYTDGDEKPVVDAWFFTHAHDDHVGACMEIANDPELVERVIVNGFYYTWPIDAGFRKESDYVDFMEAVQKFSGLVNFRDENDDVTPIYKLHAGMAFYLCDIKVDILLTQDQIMPNEYLGGFNDSSTAFKVTIYTEGAGESTFLILGDAHNGVCNKLMGKYSYDVLHTNFFMSLHHGNNNCEAFFKFIAPDYLIYTSGSKHTTSGYAWLNANCLGYVTNGISLTITEDGYDFEKINSAASIVFNS